MNLGPEWAVFIGPRGLGTGLRLLIWYLNRQDARIGQTFRPMDPIKKQTWPELAAVISNPAQLHPTTGKDTKHWDINKKKKKKERGFQNLTHLT